MARELGIGRHEPQTKVSGEWNYTSLSDPPAINPENHSWVTTIYRGLVPAKNIMERDFAVAGALVSFNIVLRYFNQSFGMHLHLTVHC